LLFFFRENLYGGVLGFYGADILDSFICPLFTSSLSLKADKIDVFKADFLSRQKIAFAPETDFDYSLSLIQHVLICV